MLEEHFRTQAYLQLTATTTVLHGICFWPLFLYTYDNLRISNPALSIFSYSYEVTSKYGTSTRLVVTLLGYMFY